MACPRLAKQSSQESAKENQVAITETSSEISFLGAGDCGPTHGPKDGFPIERYSELVRPTLATVDLRFANCERQYSTRKVGSGPKGSAHGCQPPEMAQIFTDCGFDAVTIANNHMYDYGPGPLLDTRALLLEKGIKVTGAGKNLEEARQPAIVERNGIKVGFLGYCSVLPDGGEAGPDKIGIAPLRVKTYYEPRGPHAPTRVRTEPDERDMKMIMDDIASLRKMVDILIPVFHWGVLWVPRIIADYQVTVARACIDAGADLIMGHHAHVPKAIEVYKGKAIFYSLSNFCMTKPGGPFPGVWAEAPWAHGAMRNHTDQDPDYPLLPYGKDSKRTLLAKAIFSKDSVKRVSYVPMMIDKLYRPEVLHNGDPRFDDMVRYMEWTSEGFNHKFTVEGDEVVIKV
ncbi:MAG: CapA family protein [Betaproteobacteria bacterium]|nr:CapA family protein [Betaproteobacteria bacterium]